MSATEIDYIRCKNCGESKARIRHSRNQSGRIRFVGEDGKLWNGSMCGACHCNLVKIKLYNKRHGN